MYVDFEYDKYILFRVNGLSQTEIVSSHICPKSQMAELRVVQCLHYITLRTQFMVY